MKIYNALQIKSLDIKQHLPLMMRAICNELMSFSNGDSVVPMPLHLSFPDANGECHVKAGYNNNDALFVIKVATGFYANAALGLPSSDGIMMVCCKKTGVMHAILYDGGYLTTLRTAITACIAASLTPWPIDEIGIVGTGELARLTIKLMHQHSPKTSMYLWGRNGAAVDKIQQDYPFVKREDNLSSLVKRGGVIVTTTASQAPLIYAHDIDEKIHLIALGADQPNKQEIDAEIFSIADQVIVDSKERAPHYGDSAAAFKEQKIQCSKLIEIGCVLQSGVNESAHLILTDLTGIAPQDIAIAKYVVESLTHAQPS
jgi:ornithine cyclodeaminase